LTKGKIKCMVILSKMLSRVFHPLSACRCAQFLVPVCETIHWQWVGTGCTISSGIWRQDLSGGTEMILDKL
jgi:hypothetical protein